MATTAEQSMGKCICQQKDKATFCTKYILCKMLLMVRHHPPTMAMKSKDPRTKLSNTILTADFQEHVLTK